MDGLKACLISLLICIQLTNVHSGAEVCQKKKLDCYDCDSRYDLHCRDVDRSNLTASKPRIKSCEGCCVKFYHKHPDQEPYVQRSCTEHIIINYFMVDHVCMSEGRGRGQMCFCEDNLCNSSISPGQSTIILLLESILLIYCKL